MKTFIVTIACLIIIMVFPMQNVLDTVNSHKIERLDEAVYVACQKARTDGRFTDGNIDELKGNILAIFPDVEESEITIDVTTAKKYKRFEYDSRETINYRIVVPIKKIINMNRVLGISDERNKTEYVIKGYVLSEAVE
jgi:hypothetical protein